MQKSGTRWLYEQLRAHPDFWMPPKKELQFFGRRFPAPREVRKLEQILPGLEGPDRVFAETYLAFEPGREHGVEAYKTLFQPAGDRLTGDITPHYSSLNRKRIAEIHAGLPEAKILLMVRDPVARVWSALNDAVNDGKLDAATVTDPARLTEALAARNFRHHSHPSETYRRWSRLYEVKVILLDDVIARPDRVRAEVLAHLGARVTEPETIPASHNSKAGRARAPRQPEIEAALVGHFEHEILRCARIFGGAAETWPEKYGLTLKKKKAKTPPVVPDDLPTA